MSGPVGMLPPRAGFDVIFPVRSLGLGTHRVAIVVEAPDRTAVSYVATPVTFVVEPPT